MLEMKSFDSPERAAMFIWDYIRQYEYTVFDSLSMFQITHSVNQDEVTTEQVVFDSFYEQLIDFLRDLDAQEGMYCDNEEGMHFDESPQAQDKLYRELGNKRGEFGLGGEGFLVIKNTFASAKGEFPFIVIKQSHYLLCGQYIVEALKAVRQMDDYTLRVVPAIYVEFGEK